jgi:uncharacterized protein YjbI with pentapeptide repeats
LRTLNASGGFEVREMLQLQNSIFTGAVIGDGGHFYNRVDFAGSSFAGQVSFNAATFDAGANFAGAQFSDVGQFIRAHFLTDVFFRSGHFSLEAVFIEAEFASFADFSDCNFTGDANFTQAKFKGATDFSDCVFIGTSYFVNATFGYDPTLTRGFGATFTRALFSDEAHFTGAIFGGEVNFSAADFNATANFSSANLGEHSDFSHATFAQGSFNLIETDYEVLVVEIDFELNDLSLSEDRHLTTEMYERLENNFRELRYIDLANELLYTRAVLQRENRLPFVQMLEHLSFDFPSRYLIDPLRVFLLSGVIILVFTPFYGFANVTCLPISKLDANSVMRVFIPPAYEKKDVTRECNPFQRAIIAVLFSFMVFTHLSAKYQAAAWFKAVVLLEWGLGMWMVASFFASITKFFPLLANLFS